MIFQNLTSLSFVAVLESGLKKLVKTPVTVHMDGGDLIIDWDGLNSIIMSGPAEIVFEGEFDLSLIKEYG